MTKKYDTGFIESMNYEELCKHVALGAGCLGEKENLTRLFPTRESIQKLKKILEDNGYTVVVNKD